LIDIARGRRKHRKRDPSVFENVLKRRGERERERERERAREKERMKGGKMIFVLLLHMRVDLILKARNVITLVW
jgi:hypothetical protein